MKYIELMVKIDYMLAEKMFIENTRNVKYGK